MSMVLGVCGSNPGPHTCQRSTDYTTELALFVLPVIVQCITEKISSTELHPSRQYFFN